MTRVKGTYNGKVAVCCLFFEKLDEVKRMVGSADDFFIIFVDNKWPDWDSPNILSSDGTREYINSLDNVVLLDAPNVVEHKARNMYVEKARELGFEYCLIVDSDEFIIEFHEAEFMESLEDNLDAYTLKMIQDENPTYPFCRLFKTTARYLDRHQTCYIGDKQIFESGKVIQGIITKHDKTLRPEGYEDIKLQYYYSHPIR